MAAPGPGVIPAQGANASPPAPPAYIADNGPLPPLMPRPAAAPAQAMPQVPAQVPAPAPAPATPQAQVLMPGHFPSTPPAPTPAPAPAPLPDYIHVQLLTPIPAPVPAPGYIQLPTPVPTGGPAQHAPAPAHAPVQHPPGWQIVVIPGPDGSPPPPPPPYSPTLQPDEVMERYTAAPDWTRVHILDSIIPPWQIPAGSTQPIPFKPFFVHSPTKFKEFFTAMRANPTSIAATEVIPGGNGVWFCGVGIKGSNSLDLDKRLMDLGWDGNRTGRTTVPGERDVVWLWLNRL